MIQLHCVLTQKYEVVSEKYVVIWKASNSRAFLNRIGVCLWWGKYFTQTYVIYADWLSSFEDAKLKIPLFSITLSFVRLKWNIYVLKVPGSYAHAHRHMYFCLQIIESSNVYRPVIFFYFTCADEAWMIITHRHAPILTAVKTYLSLNQIYLMSHVSKIPAQLY